MQSRLLMCMGLVFDLQNGRTLADTITALMGVLPRRLQPRLRPRWTDASCE
jgi:hypothetical protein